MSQSSKSGLLKNRRGEAAEDGTTEAAACLAPQDHLFYTSFTVSERAIAEIAQLAAGLVRNNETVRAHWARINLPPLGIS